MTDQSMNAVLSLRALRRKTGLIRALAVSMLLNFVACSGGNKDQQNAGNNEPNSPVAPSPTPTPPSPPPPTGSFTRLQNGVGTISVGTQTVEVIALNAPEWAQRCGFFWAGALANFQWGSYTALTLAQALNASIVARKPTRMNGMDQRPFITVLNEGIAAGAFPPDTFGITFKGGMAVDNKAVKLPPIVTNPVTFDGEDAPAPNDSDLLRFCQVGCFTEKAMVKIAPEGESAGKRISLSDFESMGQKPIPEVHAKYVQSIGKNGQHQVTPVLHKESRLDDQGAIPRPDLKLVTSNIRFSTADDTPRPQEVVEFSYELDGKESTPVMVTEDHPMAVWIRGEGAFLYRAKDIPELLGRKKERLHFIHKSSQYVRVLKAVAKRELVQAHHYIVGRDNDATPLLLTEDIASGDRAVQVYGEDAMAGLGQLISTTNYYPLSGKP